MIISKVKRKIAEIVLKPVQYAKLIGVNLKGGYIFLEELDGDLSLGLLQ